MFRSIVDMSVGVTLDSRNFNSSLLHKISIIGVKDKRQWKGNPCRVFRGIDSNLTRGRERSQCRFRSSGPEQGLRGIVRILFRSFAPI